MTVPALADVLKAVNAVLTSDSAIQRIFANRVFNHIPQDVPLPCLRFRLDQAGEWDTKDSSGHELYLVIDAWTDHRGDLKALEASDALNNLFHNQTLTLPEGPVGSAPQNLLLRHDFVDSFTEPDGITHHTISRFRLIVTT